MPIDSAPDGVRVTANDFSWTRARFGPPRITKGADLVGTSLVETGVVDPDRYLEAVRALAKTHGATRYFAHRRESTDKLHRLAVETGLEIVRPDLPLELIARRGPIGRTILSFPSTVVHTLPLALAGTEVRVAVCDIDPAWLTENASPRAQGFLSGVTGTARDVTPAVGGDLGVARVSPASGAVVDRGWCPRIGTRDLGVICGTVEYGTGSDTEPWAPAASVRSASSSRAAPDAPLSDRRVRVAALERWSLRALSSPP